MKGETMKQQTSKDEQETTIGSTTVEIELNLEELEELIAPIVGPCNRK
jgi:hypothetical protein